MVTNPSYHLLYYEHITQDLSSSVSVSGDSGYNKKLKNIPTAFSIKVGKFWRFQRTVKLKSFGIIFQLKLYGKGVKNIHARLCRKISSHILTGENILSSKISTYLFGTCLWSKIQYAKDHICHIQSFMINLPKRSNKLSVYL